MSEDAVGGHGEIEEVPAGWRTHITMWDVYRNKLVERRDEYYQVHYLRLRKTVRDCLGPLLDRRVQTVVDIGCGEFVSMLALADEFTEAAIVGVDASSSRLEVAEKIRKANGLESKVRVIQGDLAEKEGFGSLIGRADAVLLRHPNVGDDSLRLTQWFEVFKTVRGMMRPGGVLLMTNYFPVEQEIGIRLLEEAGFKIENSRARERKTGGGDEGNDDSYLTVARAG